jgi:hypothetical protein
LVVRLSKLDGAQLVRAVPGRWSGEVEARFLGGLRSGRSVCGAAEAAGISTTALYRRRKIYPDFREKWAMARKEGCERVSALLIAAAEAALDPEVDAEALGLPKVSVAEAIAILRVHGPDGEGRGAGRPAAKRSTIVKEEPPIEAVREEVLRRLEAMRAHREGAEDGNVTPPPPCGWSPSPYSDGEEQE